MCRFVQGRNPSEYSKMVEYIHRIKSSAAAVKSDSSRREVTISIEVEKTKPELTSLIPLADVVRTIWTLSEQPLLACSPFHACSYCLQLFVSKEFARFQGYSTMQEAVVGLRNKTKQE